MIVQLADREQNRRRYVLSNLCSVQWRNQACTTSAVQAVIDESCQQLRTLYPHAVEELISFMQTILDDVRFSPWFAAQDVAARALRLTIDKLDYDKIYRVAQV